MLRRPHFDERKLFAILLIEFGVVIPLLSAFVSPATVEPPQLTADRRLPTAGELHANDQAPVLIVHAPTAEARQPLGEQNVPTATLGVLPGEAAPTPPQATLANAPEPLAAALGPVGGAAPQVPTLLPTSVDAQAPPDMGVAPPPPIVMYHYVRNVDQGSDPLGYELSLTPELFEAHMAWLHEQGYRTLRMDSVARCIANGACPAKALALTFDDGYEDAFTTVWPVLQRYGFTATFYIISGFVGQPGYMSWEQLAALRDSGMEIGAHTIDHYDLTTLDPAESERQIVQSKIDLEHQLGISIVSFCYPTGLYNGSIVEQTRAAGYLSATTTRWDNDYSDLMALPRRRISGGMGVDSLAAIVQGN
jgi:peptidoglycan/xylan/chitin deacetylase (PgdA/CDA1 family)